MLTWVLNIISPLNSILKILLLQGRTQWLKKFVNDTHRLVQKCDYLTSSKNRLTKQIYLAYLTLETYNLKQTSFTHNTKKPCGLEALLVCIAAANNVHLTRQVILEPYITTISKWVQATVWLTTVSTALQAYAASLHLPMIHPNYVHTFNPFSLRAQFEIDDIYDTFENNFGIEYEFYV